MFVEYRHQLKNLIQDAVSQLEGSPQVEVILDVPADKQHGDLTTNAAMLLARSLKKNPLSIAQAIVSHLEKALAIGGVLPFDKVEVKAPGFINFHLSTQGFQQILHHIRQKGSQYGHSQEGKGQSFCLEFVSANPTGPLTVAHGRQAAVGDSLVNILNAVGYQAKREYYVNDEGNQINILGRSISLRAKEILGETIVFPEDHYQGDYIRSMAKEFLSLQGITNLDTLNQVLEGDFRRFGVKYLMKVIEDDLIDFGVHFDTWSYQSRIAHEEAIKALMERFKQQGLIYNQDGAWWFQSTRWGDDKDRVVQKSDGAYTYLTPDIVYHDDKFKRGFERIVNILGPDHHGYIPRIKAAAAALGKTVDALDVVIVQLATIYRNGQEVSMSTRRGEFITLRQVIDEVGRDAGRFFFLMRQTSAHLDFDLDLAKKQNADNPVYYIQYAHARIHSVIRRAQEELKIKPPSGLAEALNHPLEEDVIRKLAMFPDVLVGCAKALDPFSLTRYLQELAGSFHKFYDACRVLDETQLELSAQRLALIDGVRIVLAEGLTLLGVSAPEKM